MQAIAQTRDGYLWLGTQEGLVRFDGVKFTLFDSSRSPVFQNNLITALLEDRRGALWIGTSTGGLIELRDGVFSASSPASGHRVLSLAEDRDGDLWVGTDEGGLHRLRRGAHGAWTSYTTRDGLVDNRVRALQVEEDGGLWIGTNGGGLQRLEAGMFTPTAAQDGLSSNRVWALHRDRTGNLWVGTATGVLHCLRDGRITSYPLPSTPPQAAVRAILEDRDGNLWVGTEGAGLYRFRDGKFVAYAKRDGLSADKILALAEDREGSLWIGTESGGLNRLRDAPFTIYTTADGLPSDEVLATLEDRAGTLWIGTRTGLAERPAGAGDGRFVSTGAEVGLDRQAIMTIAEDRRGDLWVGTFGAGLYRRHEGRWSTLTEREGLASNLIRAAIADSQDDLWVATSNAGVNRLHNGAWSATTMKDGLGSDHIWCVMEGRRGEFWIGTQGGGLSVLRAGRLKTYTVADGLGSNTVSALYEDAQGTLWIGTQGGGLSRLDGTGKIATYTTRDGLPSDVVFQILEDEVGNLWMSCNKGIFRIAKRDAEQRAQGRLGPIPAVAYGTTEGMRSAECNGGFQPAGMRTRDGRLWFPTVKGAAVIDPRDLKINRIPPPVTIEQIVVDGKLLASLGDAALGPGARNLEIHYTALSLVAPERVQFRYRLEGFDPAWVEAGARRIAYYTNVPPGRYRFRVIAANNDSVWNLAGAAIGLRVLPRFYETPWFYTLIAIALAAALWGAHRLRIRRMQATHAAVLAERNRMAREIHDTLGQGFTGVLLRLAAAESALHRAPEEVTTHLSEARRLGVSSLDEARRSVMALRPQALEGSDLLAAITGLARQITDLTGIPVRSSLHGEPRHLTPELELNLLRIAQEALTNAVKHARAGQMSVDLAFSTRQLTLRIADDGVGLGEEAPPARREGGGGFGITSMRERAELLGGTLALRRLPAGGTEVSVEVPA